MWGTRGRLRRRRNIGRLIPTHVGNTIWIIPGSHDNSVHPHACGEHITRRQSFTRTNGSSPRMWGTQFLDSYMHTDCRFIPTHVGNTCVGPREGVWRSVHPHACGEHVWGGYYMWFLIGSSPRMWGTQLVANAEDGIERFIPTHVGNTSRRWSMRAWCAVHPHACGEHFNTHGTRYYLGGSSPRMWGTRTPTGRYRPGCGSSPRMWGTQDGES